ncbi:MAG TPA: hypothetical protein VJG32_16555 [Anaerolineae bacterium]|nr:hypothetical protein [Anaerolineae bacterium]
MAILQSATGRPPAFVYADRAPLTAPHSVCLILDDLPGFDLAPYNGPVTAFSALDIVRPELITKGPRFRSIEPLLRERIGQAGLNQSTYALAAALLGFIDDTAPRPTDPLRVRALPHIIELALPSLLARRSLRGLAGLRVGPDLWNYLQDYAAQWIYLSPDVKHVEDALSLADFESASPLAADEWLIALEEVRLLRSEVDRRATRFIDLRPILRVSGHADMLRTTLNDLSHFCFHRARRDTRFILPAWSLMAEYWLSTEEVEDLVCFIPDSDYRDFARTGAGARYYRTLPGVESSDPGPYQLATLESLFDSDTPVTPNTEAALALPILHPCLHARGLINCLDLGYVLWRAGRASELAGTLALLARDVSDLSPLTREQRGLNPEAAYDAAWRACLVLGLETPEAESHGFHAQLIQATYQTLSATLNILAGQSSPLQRSYYLGLSAWLSCYNPESAAGLQIEQQLRQVVRHLSMFCRAQHPDLPLFTHARQILDIANASLSLLSGGSQPEAIQDYLDSISAPVGISSDHQRAAADAQSRPPALSDFFVRGFQRLAVLAEQIRLLYQSSLHEDDKVRHLAQMTTRLEEAERQLFALPHELAVLHTLFEQTIWQTANLARELKGSAVLELQLTTSTVQQHTPSRLTFELRNLGRAPADTVKITLDNSERFNILGLTANVEYDQVLPGASLRVAFDIHPRVDDQLPLRLTVSYRDQHGYHSKPQDFTAHVVSLDRGPFVRKRNPYIFGNPIQDPQHFYGRQAEVMSVIDHLVASGAQNILLRGARRTGKTSVLYMLKSLADNFPGARTRFGIHPTWTERLDALRVVFLDLSGLSGVGRRISAGEFYAAISSATARAVGLNAESPLALPMNRALFQQEMERCLDTLPPNGRLVILLDEFDVVETITDAEFYYHLRHVITYLQRITWIVASAAGLYQAVQDYASPLFNVFRIVETTRLNPSDARRLILDPIASERVQFLDEAVEAVLEQAGRHPYFLQLLCSEIIEHLNTRQTNYVLRSTVQTVVEDIVGRGRAAYDHFAYLWDHTDSFSRLILAHLLATPETLDHEALWGRVCAQVRQAYAACDEIRLRLVFEQRVRWLQNVVEAIVFDAQRGYIFGTPLFRYWLNERGQREDLYADALAQVVEIIKDSPRADD